MIRAIVAKVPAVEIGNFLAIIEKILRTEWIVTTLVGTFEFRGQHSLPDLTVRRGRATKAKFMQEETRIWSSDLLGNVLTPPPVEFGVRDVWPKFGDVIVAGIITFLERWPES